MHQRFILNAPILFMTIIESLGHWNYLLLAILVFAEGPTATLIGAAAAAAGFLNPWAVFSVAAISNLTADTFWYTLGRLGHKNIYSWAEKFGVQNESIVYYQKRIHHHALTILLAAKLTLSFIIPALIAAGLARIPWRKVFPPLFLGETIWTGGLTLIGFFLTSRITQLEQNLQVIALLGGIFFFILILYLFRHHIRHRFTNISSPHR